MYSPWSYSPFAFVTFVNLFRSAINRFDTCSMMHTHSSTPLLARDSHAYITYFSCPLSHIWPDNLDVTMSAYH